MSKNISIEMSNNTTEQALIQIEKNLEKLDSARKQVLNVTKSGNEIGAIMVELVAKIQDVYEIISYESDTFIDGFANNQKKLDKNTEEYISKANSSSGLFLEQLKGLTHSFTEKLNKTSDLSISKAESLLSSQQIAFDKHISVLSDFNNVLSGFKQSIVEANLIDQLKPVEEKIISIGTDVANAIDNLVKDLRLFIIEQNNLLYEKTSANNIQLLRPLEQSLKEIEKSSIALAIETKKNQSDIINSITEQFNNFQSVYLKQTNENNELLKLLNKKIDSNKAIYFYVTWFIIFFGFIISVYLIKRF